MSKSLSALLPDIQALLQDDGTRFSTETITAAVREALKAYNEVAPVRATAVLSVVPGQREYFLDDPVFANLVFIRTVHKAGVSGPDIPLKFEPYWLENEPGIRLSVPLHSGDLVIGFDVPNTVDELDDETASTIPDHFDQVLINGGAYHALIIRATGRAETINLNKGVTDQYLQLAATYKVAFDAGLNLVKLQRAPRGEPARFAWTLNTEREF